MKKHTAGKKFDNDDEVTEEVIKWLKEQAAAFYKASILKLTERLQ